MCARQPLARSHALTRAYTTRSYAVCRTALAAVAVVVPRARCAVAAPTTRRGRRRVAPSSTAATPARACALPTAPVRLARSLGDPSNLFIHLLARSLSRLLGSAVVPAVVAGAWRAAVHHVLRVLLLLRGAVPLLSIAPCDGIRAQHATQLPRTLGCVACTAPVPPWLTWPRECTTHTQSISSGLSEDLLRALPTFEFVPKDKSATATSSSINGDANALDQPDQESDDDESSAEDESYVVLLRGCCRPST